MARGGLGTVGRPSPEGRRLRAPVARRRGVATQVGGDAEGASRGGRPSDQKPRGFPHTVHGLRRFFATALTAAEVSDTVVRQLLGHAASGVAGKFYTGAELAAMTRALDRIVLSETRVSDGAGFGAARTISAPRPSAKTADRVVVSKFWRS